VSHVGGGPNLHWPYLGHGRWGRRVTKENPIFRDVIPLPEGLIRGASCLGSSTATDRDDVVYLEPNRLTFWITYK